MKIELNKRRQIRYIDSRHLEAKLGELTDDFNWSIWDFLSIYSEYEMHNLTTYLNADDEAYENVKSEMAHILVEWKKLKEKNRKKWSYDNIVEFISSKYESVNDFIISWIEKDIDKSFYKYFITLNSRMRIGLYLDLIKNHQIPLYSTDSRK